MNLSSSRLERDFDTTRNDKVALVVYTMNEARHEFPLWLELSGLPDWLNSKVRKDAWSVFKKVAELDCAANIDPGVVEISMSDLARRTGIAPDSVEKCLSRMRKKKILACFIPDNPDESALIRVVIPLASPIAPQEIKKKYEKLFPPGKDFFRYVDEKVPEPADDEVLQEIVDLYFNSLGLKMNLFILDELRLLRQRFELPDVKRAFELAKRLEIKSLKWVMRQLISGKKTDGKRKGRKTKKSV
ncbi:hypothetical protein JW926_04385 [Candidatus Sumerlaeota bacterium]|nr:hypothetical protein [Candidatus Sumerlaeota bacterium]